MDLRKYVGKQVRVDLVNGFYYVGKVLDTTTHNSLEMIDRKGNNVSLSAQSILYIREEAKMVGNG